MVVLLLITHLMLGFRRLQDLRYYRDDPMVRRLLGLSGLPDVATVSRMLAGLDGRGIDQLRRLNRQLVLERLSDHSPARVTLDFDGSVIATGRFAEGTAVGYNRKKKGQRSYYPLFCTVAQTGQVPRQGFGLPDGQNAAAGGEKAGGFSATGVEFRVNSALSNGAEATH